MTKQPCPVCHSEKLKILPPFYLFRERQYDLQSCCHCGVFFVVPQPDAETLKLMYGKDYFESDFHCGHSSQSAYEHQEIQLPSWMKQITIAPSSDVLEIGCATGYLLNVFSKAGYRCVGIEISDDATQFAREHYRLDVYAGTVEETDLGERRFDLIYLHDVFEHLTSPLETLQKIRNWLKPDGTVVIVIPTQTNTLFSRIGMLLYSLLNKRTRVILPPYHVFEYRPKSIRRLMIQSGFNDVRLFPGIMKPSAIALRGPFIQRIAKKILHYPNYIISRITGLWGDRLTVIAKQPNS
jgi:SAM-dependent methyltransferase